MKQNFNDCLNRLLKDEGGYTNDSLDPGGPTNFGITLKDYQLHINPNGTAEDVKHMNVEDAKRIYRAKYWDALNCDNLSSGVDYTCFDYGVNSGLGRPRKVLQRFKSLQGIPLINAINDERMAFLRALRTFPRFGKGWTLRVTGVRAYSLKLAGQKDQTSGPITGVTATVGFWATMSQYFHAHPYLIASASVAIGVGLWALVHYIANRKVGVTAAKAA